MNMYTVVRNVLPVLAAVVTVSACQKAFLHDGLSGGRFPLQESYRYTAPAVCLQNLKLQAGTETRYYQLVYDATSDIHQLVVLTAIGQRLVTVTQAGDGITVRKSLPVALDFQPRELLLVMQLIHWPAAVLQSAISDSKWRIVADDSTRYVYRHDELLAEIVYRDFKGCRGVAEYRSSGGDVLSIESVPL